MLFSINTMWTQLCLYAYLCEYCIMGRWPLCTINFWIWIYEIYIYIYHDIKYYKLPLLKFQHHQKLKTYIVSTVVLTYNISDVTYRSLLLSQLEGSISWYSSSTLHWSTPLHETWKQINEDAIKVSQQLMMPLVSMEVFWNHSYPIVL